MGITGATESQTQALAVDIVEAWIQRNAPGAAAIPTRPTDKTLPVFVQILKVLKLVGPCLMILSGGVDL
jgi:hypothetical protein